MKKKTIYLIIITGILLVVTGVILPSASLLKEELFPDLLQRNILRNENETSYDLTIPFTNQLYFSYDLSKIEVNEHGAKLKQGATSEEIRLHQNVELKEGTTLKGFEEVSVKPDGTSITYQISTDHDNWYYHNGDKWLKANNSCKDCHNTVEEINKEIKTLPIYSNVFRIKASLNGTTNKTPRLYSIKLIAEGEKPVLTQRQKNWVSVLGAEKDTNEVPTDGECLCDRGILILRVRYEGPNGVDIEVTTRKYGFVDSFTNVQNGQILTVDGSGLEMIRLGAETTFSITGAPEPIPDATIHTSCSEPILGVTFGNFTVTSFVDGNGNPCNEDNIPPELFNNSASLCENTSVIIDVLTNDSDPDGYIDPQTTNITISPVHGDTSVNTDTGAVTYTPDTDYTGMDEFTYEACDNDGACGTAIVTINVNSCQSNDPPEVADDNLRVCVNESGSVNVLANDTDPDNNLDPSSLTIITDPGNGTITNINTTTGVVTYMPDTNYIGNDIATYQVCDTEGACATGNIYIIVESCHTPEPPDPRDDSARLCNDTSTNINVLANDTDPNNLIDPTTVWVFAGPGNGTATVNPTTGVVTYTPYPGFFGLDLFNYEVCNTNDECATAKVTITVDDCTTPDPDPDYSVFATCIDLNEDNTYSAQFGYINRLDQNQSLDSSNLSPSDGSVSGSPPQTLTSGLDTKAFTATGPINTTIVWTASVDEYTKTAIATSSLPLCNPGTPEPPQPQPDTYTICSNTTEIFDLAENDYDPDGEIDLTSLTITDAPTNGTILFLAEQNGSVQYTPNEDFIGIDAFAYSICDDDGLCAETTVIIQVIDCTTPEEPTSASFGVNPELCEQRIYNNVNLAFTGYSKIPASIIEKMQYSLENALTKGSSWRDITFDPTKDSIFNIDLFELESGTYNLQIRIEKADGSFDYADPCEFIVDPSAVDPECLIFGANEFVLNSQASPVSDYGIISFVKDQPQTFYLEAKCATTAAVIDIDNSRTYPLEYDYDLKLWTGELVFDKTGLHRLRGFVGSPNGEYTREINSVYVTEEAMITDLQTDEPITEATITVFEKDVDTEEFVKWKSESYGISNPFSPDGNGNYSVILPKGEFYLRIESKGYRTATSLITTIEDHSVVTGKVELAPTGNLWERFVSLVSRNNRSNNFELTVEKLPKLEFLKVGSTVPPINVHDENGNEIELIKYISDLEDKKPTILMVYTNWNTLSEEQLVHFTNLSEKYDEYRFIPITTMEPENRDLTYIERGRYDIVFYEPEDSFYDNYFIISLPHFFVLDEEQVLKGVIVGPYSQDELEQRITNLIEN